MAGGFNTDDDVISGINVTPLVDVVLVLLVIFLMTAPVIYQSAIKVQLPKAKTGETAEKSPFNFTINKAGEVMWDKEKMSWETLNERLKKLGPQAAEQTAVINADEATAHGVVIKLMDALRGAGLTHFALSVEGPAK